VTAKNVALSHFGMESAHIACSI